MCCGHSEQWSNLLEPLTSARLAVIAVHHLTEEATLAARLAEEAACHTMRQLDVEDEVLLVAVLLVAKLTRKHLQKQRHLVSTLHSQQSSPLFAYQLKYLVHGNGT